MLLSDWLWFFHKTIIALSGGHFEYFLSFPKKITLVYGLEGLFRAHDEITFALLYGSMVTPEVPERYGDLDLAIHVRPDRLQVEQFVLESQIEAEIYRHLSVQRLNYPPVEVLVVNNAPYSFLNSLLRGAYIVLKEDEETLTDFIEEVSGRSMANSHLRSESLREVTEA
jgi:predicted nucleotidyltransferase